MILPIYLYGNPVLKKVGIAISQDYPNLKELISNMWETMNFAKGVGLAAPQIGLSIRLFVVDSIPHYESSESDKGIKKVFINPVILKEYGQKWPFEEGCLSIPKINAEVERYSHLKIKYYDENFKKHIEVFDEMNARIIQHEYDHIDGVLFIDKIKPIRKQILQKKLNKIKRGIVNALYPVCN